MPPPEITNHVTIFVVPFSPTGRKFPYLVAARSAVPWLRDQFYAIEHWVLCACLQKTALVIESVRLSSQNCSQIKTKSVDSRLFYPVTQAVQYHLDDPAMADVQRVSGTGIVDIASRVIRYQAIVAAIVDSFEGERWTTLVSFCVVVVNHIQDNF